MPGIPKFERDTVVSRINERLEQFAHIKIQNFVSSIIGRPWKVIPIGFKFFCKDADGLARALHFSPRFALATARFDQVVNGIVFREVSRPNSLHFTLYADPKAECVVHLDSVSIVVGRDPLGHAMYVTDISVLLRHLAVDRLGLDQGEILPEYPAH